MSSGPNTLLVHSVPILFHKDLFLMISLNPEIHDHLMTRDWGTIHKLKPRLFIKSYSTSMSFLSTGVFSWGFTLLLSVRLAKFKAGIKPTAPLSVFDKENSIEFSLDSVHYLYKQSNPNPVLLFRAPLWVNLLSHVRYYKLKEKKRKRKTIFKTKRKEKKRNIK